MALEIYRQRVEPPIADENRMGIFNALTLPCFHVQYNLRKRTPIRIQRFFNASTEGTTKQIIF